ncbi:hypothetical protein IQ06DRAFT_3140 [Phaeosphaeriaceae sp. SRC1lsM3a]|nr:hypothetical protein IQ06DRAFT_3140 [Stagonospora sp. SRC1lsM3a]
MLSPTSNMFNSRRVSALFTPRLTDPVEKLDSPTQGSATNVLSICHHSRSSREGTRVGSVQAALDLAEPAESPTDPFLILQNKYPALRSLRTDADIGDGMWICCHCRHENILRHWKGPFPFKYLRCDRCDRQVCHTCHSSEILTPWPFGMISARPPPFGCQVRYCQICTKCGLGHRAEMVGSTLDFYGVTCAGCGTSSYGDWPRYYIGSVEPYRRDPDSSFVKLLVARADDAAKLVFERETTEPEMQLACTNPA